MAPPRTIAVGETTVNDTAPRPLGRLGRTVLAIINHFTRLWNSRTGAIFISSSLSFLCFLPLWLVVATLAPKEELCTPLTRPTILKVLYFIIPCFWIQMMWMSIMFFGMSRRNRGWGARGGASRDITSMAALCFRGIAVTGIALLIIGCHWSGDICSDED